MISVQQLSDRYIIKYKFDRQITNALKRLVKDKQFDPVLKEWHVPLHEYKGVQQLEQMYGRPPQAPEQVGEILPLPELKVNIPLKLNPYHYQKNGIAYNIEHKKVLVSDDMGLGKTGQVIASLIALNTFPALVICPSSLKINWQREVHMWTDKRAMVLTDRVAHTWPYFLDPDNNLFGAGSHIDVIITNYESLKKYFVVDIITPPGETMKLRHVIFSPHIAQFKALVIDESHRVKEPTSQQTIFTKGLSMNREAVFAMSGTPVVNTPNDLITQLSIIGQLDKFGGAKKFKERYGFGEFNKELNYLLNKHCFYRRLKTDVLKELPPKIRQKVYCDIDTSEEYRVALNDLAKYLKEYKQATDTDIRRSLRGEVMVRMSHLKRISARGKLKAIDDYVQDVLAAGLKIILFIHHDEVAEPLLELYPDAVTVRGSDNDNQRQKNIDSFQDDPDVSIMICSIKAAGVGLNLTAATRVGFVEQPWTAADADQCEDRSFRIGQRYGVHCLYFLGRSTIDEYIYQVIDQKRKTAAEITGDQQVIQTDEIDSIINLLTQNL